MKPYWKRLAFVGVSMFVALIGALASVKAASIGTAPAAYNINPPASPVRLIFIHHSTGENWLNDTNGQLGIALRDNNYFVSDTNYDWGPVDQAKSDGTIGDHTDIPDWYSWFTGPYSGTYLAALYAETGQHSGYSRLETNPGGENTIIMFKSCFPNSNLGGNPDDAPADSADMNSPLEVAYARRIYLDALNYFAAHQSKLFVVITAPPLAEGDTDAAQAANARAFNDWLVNDWLGGYPYHNVAVFDFYDVLTSNGGDSSTNDLNGATGNHHRYRGGVIEHITTQGVNFSAYPTGDSHPSEAGNLKATGEFVPLLNIAWHCWQGDGGCPGAPNVTPLPDLSTSGRLINKTVFEPGEPITYTLQLINSGSVSTTVRFTVTLPAEVVTPTGALSGTVFINAGTTLTPTVIVAQVKADLTPGAVFQAQVDIDDDYHPVYTLSFPQAAIHSFYSNLPLIMRGYALTQQAIIIDHTTTDLSKGQAFWWMMARLAGWDGVSP